MCFKEEKAPSMPLTWSMSWGLGAHFSRLPTPLFPSAPLMGRAKLGPQAATGIKPPNPSDSSVLSLCTHVPFTGFLLPLQQPQLHHYKHLHAPARLWAQALGAGGEICPSAGHNISLKMETSEPNVSRNWGGHCYLYPGFSQIIQQMSLR